MTFPGTAFTLPDLLGACPSPWRRPVSAAPSAVSAGPLVHRSERMARLIDLAKRVARSDANVLLCGESGTGKGMLARFLHDASPRNAGPFVTISGY